MHFFWY